MLTLILPGHSPYNEEWAKETVEKLNVPGEIEYIAWDHWSTGGNIHIKEEVSKILKVVGTKEVSFVAKSIGTKVLMRVLPEISGQVKKVILCGIPISPVDYKRGLDLLNPSNILIFQNTKDPFMPYALIEKYIRLINKDIKVVKKEASNHHYPYYEDFQKFLTT